jgi:transcriptional regulator with XRE-family HTH domain
MCMINKMFVLKTYRRRKGIALQDMATIIGIDSGNLSKIESCKTKASVEVVISYHLLLEIPLKELFKQNFLHIVANCTENASVLRADLLNQLTSPEPSKRIIQIDNLIDRLTVLQENYGK